MSRKMIIYWSFMLAGIFLSLLSHVNATSDERRVYQLTIDGAIGPATDDYIQRALEDVQKKQTELVVILLDTPGGLDSAMRNIIKNIANSSVPIASYVAPTGARAASAGTYILYASHIAAMAPGTNLGAATPVQIGGGLPPSPAGSGDRSKSKEKETGTATNEESMRSKVVNDAVAYIRGLAKLRGRNEDWAEKAVREAASLPAEDALKMNVIDVVAGNVPDLLRKVHGKTVNLDGRSQVLRTKDLPITSIDPDWRSRLLAVITNPNVAYILMLIGIYGLILEFSNPGAIVPGTVGAIALLLALYSFQLLPVNYAGAGLMLLGIALMIAEAFEPSFGILGLGGVAAFVIGSIILMDTAAPGFGIDLWIIVLFAGLSALVFVFVVGMAIKARKRKVVSGMEELVGSEAVVLNDFSGKGQVAVHSEIWSAHSAVPLDKDQRVRVTGIKGLVLDVEPVEQQNSQSR